MLNGLLKSKVKSLFLVATAACSAQTFANEHDCRTITSDFAHNAWRVNFTVNLEETVPYFFNGETRCYIGRDITLEELSNFRFKAFKKRHFWSFGGEPVYNIKVSDETFIEQLKLDSTRYGKKFLTVSAYTPEGLILGGAGTSAIPNWLILFSPWINHLPWWAQFFPWWLHGYTADQVKPQDYPYPLIAENFPSGNAGRNDAQITGTQSAAITLRNDGPEDWLNAIPKWRNWWYLELSGVFTDTPFTFSVNDKYTSDKRGWEYDYTPLYSYDGEKWHRFDASEITVVTDEVEGEVTRTIEIDKQFDSNNVLLSRFYPYSSGQFDAFYEDFITKLPEEYVTKETLGHSPILGKPIDLVTITNPYVDAKDKKRVWIHARTHSAEVGGSLLVEGLMNFLARSDEYSQEALDNLIFHIVPVHNPDGVDLGHYRLNGSSVNLEVMWQRDENNPMLLNEDAPIENRLLNEAMLRLAEQDGKFTMALNLHSSQSDPDTRPFFYPHFGPESLGYSKEEAELWNKTVRFIDGVKASFGEDLIEPTPEEGGSSFASRNYPESWWWTNYGSDVMAVTFETTYDKSGFAPNYVTEDSLRRLGESMAISILSYHDLPIPAKQQRFRRSIFTRQSLNKEVRAVDPVVLNEDVSKQ
ncbi:M14-type cytosolic carboxypeptidase [Grimontia sp. NTOU-MAR1]|uniref:M14-type cytosolic carboxypeptidase n=1 Tax=Grimontia sp. NTOU-MAR1 TaxID=3111011 RepID=UPI002DBF4C39|nr:M14-type cytosolic carboxypeptidase [Grimontia sp. NTOU-MAR1]WRW00272.1 M14-type cytosolic carboxypeptidase [Grimontia sp. NTOU-MAR1]